jgi:ABC-type nitrate/sulfonate/bicarbonate transport system ATPase subunit
MWLSRPTELKGNRPLPGQETIFECRNLDYGVTIARGYRRILEAITLDVYRGEFLTIVGGSGTGKTSLLRLLGGLTPASAGDIRFRGNPVNSPPEGVVVVFQDYSRALLQWRTVAANVALGLEGRLDGAVLRERVERALQMVGLERCAGDQPWQLSGGMQQRVQIARALALQPDVLMMDEPFGALDAMTKATLQDELLKVHARTGTSFVFITHDIEEAVYLGDRVVVLGGSPGQIYKTVPVELPQPRDQISTRQSAAFLRHRSDIHAAVRETVTDDAHQ